MAIKFNEEELLDAFVFLDALRKTGATNMMGATGYIQGEFEWPKNKASKALSLWMQTFGGPIAMDDRVMAALELVAHEV